MVLNNLFLAQQQQHLVAKQPQPPQGGHSGLHHPSSSEGPSTIYTFEMVDLQNRAKYYGALVANAEEASLSQNPLLPNNLHIKSPVVDLVISPPKGVLHRTMQNTSSHATQNHNIVEDLARAPSAMLVLEVLQTCPVQRKALLSTIGGIDL